MLGLAIVSATAGPSVAAETDGQRWTELRLNHPVNEEWSVALWGQGRVADNFTEPDQLLVMPSLHYRIVPGVEIGAGSTYWAKKDSKDEVYFTQELSVSNQLGAFVIGNRVRLEERLISGISGAILRNRYRVHLTHPIGTTRFSIVASNEVFVNLNDKHEGPVHGYEQNRLFAGIGVRLGRYMRAELGYLWRNEDTRSSSQNDHVINLSLFIDTKGSTLTEPESGESND